MLGHCTVRFGVMHHAAILCHFLNDKGELLIPQLSTAMEKLVREIPRCAPAAFEYLDTQGPMDPAKPKRLQY